MADSGHWKRVLWVHEAACNTQRVVPCTKGITEVAAIFVGVNRTQRMQPRSPLIYPCRSGVNTLKVPPLAGKF